MKRFVSILCLGFLVGTAYGASYYVATTGSDGATGAIGDPWRTIDYGGGRLNPGDTLFVRAGTYRESVDINPGSGPGAMVIVRAYPGETVYLKGSFELTGWSLYSGSVYSAPFDPQWRTRSLFEDGVRYQLVNSLVEVNGPGKAWLSGGYNTANAGTYYIWCLGGDNPSGHLIEASSHNCVGLTSATDQYIRVQGFTIRHGTGSGTIELSNCNNIEIVSNDIAQGSGGDNNNAAAIFTVNTATPPQDTLIKGCVMHDIWDINYPSGGVNNFAFGQSYYTERSVVEDCVIYNTALAINKGSNNNGIYRRNIIYDCDVAFWQGINTAQIYENIVYNCNDGIVFAYNENGTSVYNNVFDITANGVRCRDRVTNMDFRNNIVISFSPIHEY